MQNRILIATITLAGIACPLGAEDAPSPRELFEKAMPLLEANDFRSARPLLEQARAGAPDEPGLLWNLGIVYAELEEHESALSTWQSMAQLEPTNWLVTAKIVQAYQGLNRATERDEAIKRLLAQRKKDRDPERKRQAWFCREQCRIQGRGILALEYFEPKGPQRVYFTFVAQEPGGNEAFRLSLGSYDATTEIARSTGEIGPMGRLYHLDYYEKNGHRTYGFFKKLPSYDEIRERVVAVLTKSTQPISSTSVIEERQPAPPPPTPSP